MAKKKVNVELNLTPFIGLFALLVVMLLLTASWNQVYSLNTNTATSSESESPPPDEERVNLSVTVMTEYLELSANEENHNIPHRDGEVDLEPFIEILKSWKERFPKQTAVTLNTHNQVRYNELIVVFDALVGNGWPDVGVSTH